MHPILFHIGSFPVALYGVMIATGLALGLWLALRLAARDGLEQEPIYDMAFASIMAGFIGGRILYIGLNWGDFTANPKALIFSREGFVFLGGLIAAVAVDLGYVFWKKLPVWRLGDAFAPGLVIGHALGRVGCFFSGCCYGGIAEHSPFALRFPKIIDRGEVVFSYAYHDHVHSGLIPPTATASLPVLPSQLFEAGSNVAICLVLLWLWRRRSFSGQIFISYLLLYGAARFLLEYTRGDAARGLWFGGAVSTSQLVSLGLILAGAILWPILSSRPSNRAEAEPSAPRQMAEPAEATAGGGGESPAAPSAAASRKRRGKSR